MENVLVNISNRVFENSLKEKYKSLCHKQLTSDEKNILLLYLELMNCELSNRQIIIITNNLKDVF